MGAYSYGNTGFKGIGDLFPSIGKWIEGNRERIQRPRREAQRQQMDTMLGGPSSDYTMTGPEDQLTTTLKDPGSGLMSGVQGAMADKMEFYQQMKFANGMMAMPGYEQAGAQFQQQSLRNQLGKRQARQDHNQWVVEQQNLMDKTAAAQALAEKKDTRAGDKQTFDQQQNLAKEYTAGAAPYLEIAQRFTSSQNIVKKKGFEGMNIVDDVVFVKNLAKMILPKESVMSEEASAIAAVDLAKYPEMGFAKILATQLGGGVSLNPTQRKQVYDAMYQLAGESMNQYNSYNTEFERKTTEYGLDPKQTIRQDNMGRPGGYENLLIGNEVTAQQEADEQARIQASFDEANPDLGDKVGGWIAGWGD